MRPYVATFRWPKRKDRRLQEVLGGDPGNEGVLWPKLRGSGFYVVEMPRSVQEFRVPEVAGHLTRDG